MAVQQVNFKQDETEEPTDNIVSFSDKVGKMLVQARRERQLTINQIAKILNIRSEYLTAFEKNDFSKPSSSYAQGFLKSYATYLNLDASAIINELKSSGYIKNEAKHYIPQPIETNIIPSRTIILVSMIIFTIVLVVWGIYTLQPTKSNITIPSPEISTEPTKKIKVKATNANSVEKATNKKTIKTNKELKN